MSLGAKGRAERSFKDVWDGAVRSLGRITTMFILRFSSFLSHSTPKHNTKFHGFHPSFYISVLTSERGERETGQNTPVQIATVPLRTIHDCTSVCSYQASSPMHQETCLP